MSLIGRTAPGGFITKFAGKLTELARTTGEANPTADFAQKNASALDILSKHVTFLSQSPGAIENPSFIALHAVAASSDYVPGPTALRLLGQLGLSSAYQPVDATLVDLAVAGIIDARADLQSERTAIQGQAGQLAARVAQLEAGEGHLIDAQARAERAERIEDVLRQQLAEQERLLSVFRAVYGEPDQLVPRGEDAQQGAPVRNAPARAGAPSARKSKAAR